jgi:hypothetical protein
MIQREVVLDEIFLSILELQFVCDRTNFQDTIANDAVPPVSLLAPSEDLSTTQGNIEVQGAG